MQLGVGLSNFPQKNVTNVYGSMLLPLQGCHFSRKNMLRNTWMTPLIAMYAHLWRVDRLVEQTHYEAAKLVDDELTGTDAVDVGGLEFTVAQPLGVLHVYVRPRVVGAW